MAFIKYRASLTPTVPVSTTLKGSALDNLEIDGNFKSLADGLTSLATGTGASGTWGISISGNAATATLATTTTTATTATNATNVAIINDNASAGVMYPMWSPNAAGNNAATISSTKLTFVPSTGVLTASGGFVGPLSGNATSATTAITATNATNVAVINDNGAAGTTYPMWSFASTGNNAAYASSTKLTFVPSTGTLTATTFVGALSGNATSATSATTATTATNATNVGITNDTTTNATMYPAWVTTTTGNLPSKVSSTKLTFNPSTGTLSATTFVGALTGIASGNTTLSAIQVFTKNQSVTPTTLPPGASVPIVATDSNNFILNIGANATFTLQNPSALTSGMVINITLKQDATGGRVITWSSMYKFPAGADKILSTGANAVDLLSAQYDSANNILLCNLLKGFS